MRRAAIITALGLACAYSGDSARAGVLSLGCDAPPSLRSAQGDTPITLKFSNLIDQPIQLRWIDYEGRLISYSTLKPREAVSQPTYATHPWRIETTDGQCLGIVIGSTSDTVVISWSEAGSAGTTPSASYCEQNPGVCILGLLFGAAAIGAMAGPSAADGTPTCTERYLGRDHMGNEMFITECR